jgi:hypothetical protein
MSIESTGDLVEIEAVMAIEAIVLGRHHRPAQPRRDALDGHRLSPWIERARAVEHTLHRP